MENLGAITFREALLLVDPEAVEGAIAGVDAVVNFAAETHVDRSILAAAEFIQTDVAGTQVLLEQARHAGIRLLHVSTDEVYGDLELDDPGPGEVLVQVAAASFLGWAEDDRSFFVSTNERDPRFMDLYEYAVDGYGRTLVFRNEGGFDLGPISPPFPREDRVTVPLAVPSSRVRSNFFVRSPCSSFPISASYRSVRRRSPILVTRKPLESRSCPIRAAASSVRITCSSFLRLVRGWNIVPPDNLPPDHPSVDRMRP